MLLVSVFLISSSTYMNDILNSEMKLIIILNSSDLTNFTRRCNPEVQENISLYRPGQAEGSRKLRLPDFKTIGT